MGWFPRPAMDRDILLLIVMDIFSCRIVWVWFATVIGGVELVRLPRLQQISRGWSRPSWARGRYRMAAAMARAPPAQSSFLPGGWHLPCWYLAGAGGNYELKFFPVPTMNYFVNAKDNAILAVSFWVDKILLRRIYKKTNFVKRIQMLKIILYQHIFCGQQYIFCTVRLLSVT